jgi:hypothetical protein
MTRNERFDFFAGIRDRGASAMAMSSWIISNKSSKIVLPISDEA